jgi:Uma2 family endonuclease
MAALITAREFERLNYESRFELVEGRLEHRPAGKPVHARIVTRVLGAMGRVLERDRRAYYGVSLDIPLTEWTVRCPDLVYYSPEDAADGICWAEDRVTGMPTLVIEVTSPEDPVRDWVTKREEYGRAGIAHYWIFDSEQHRAVAFKLEAGEYAVARSYSGDEIFTSDPLPGIEIPLNRLFRM